MSEALEHRGPDEEGVFREGPVGLAHRRLSIVDPAGGTQPMANEGGDVIVVFNGEIYNHRSVRNELSNRHEFRSDADTEVILHAYEEYGLEMVTKLKGMFAFAIWDAKTERLVLARDPVGIKPLYVTTGPRPWFASELSALLEAGIDHGGLDRTAIGQYFALGFVPAPRTVFRNVRAVSPGEMHIVDDSGHERMSYYDWSVTARNPSFERAAVELRDKVDRSVRGRLMSDVPLGAFLSGGLDSTVIVGTLAELCEEPVQTYTVGFDEARFDESAAAKIVADYHATDHTEYTVSPADLKAAVPSVVGRLGQPFADQSLIPTHVVSQKSSQDVTVTLSGDGADELFLGYDKYRGEYYSSYYRSLPKPLRSLIENSLSRAPRSRGDRIGEFVRKADKFTRSGTTNPVDRHFEWLRITDEQSATATTVDPLHAGRTAIREWNDRVTPSLPSGRRDSLTQMQAIDTRVALPEQLLHKVDLASMYNSLEVRVPFLSTDIVKYALSLPRQHKMTALSRKRLLRQAFADRIPDEIADRPKRGFDMPVGEWFKSELADEFQDTLGRIDSTVLDTSAVRTVYDEHCKGQAEHGKFLWSVYVYAQWEGRLRASGVID
ncbi:asparagine synthase (glutamine-hydrolyzing) [Haloarcula pelagica]|uniref:asparagine synthase (glutamine-hydrolyzing) n=2 Tax=Haloarcula TaxID=2237 RepID=UPI0024C3BB63|nr:asparagine synthase (glutamine-hydrolyzing) [Halomicroarcula sp. YJ-61-S]